MSSGNNSNGDSSRVILPMAKEFFFWLHRNHGRNENNNNSSSDINLTTGVDREQVGELFQTFHLMNASVMDAFSINSTTNKKKKRFKRTEGLVMAALRRQRLMRSKRYTDVVICVFAQNHHQHQHHRHNDDDGGGGDNDSSSSSPPYTFAPIQERQTQRAMIRQQRIDLHQNKEGIRISEEPTTSPHDGPIYPINDDTMVEFNVFYEKGSQEDNDAKVVLQNVILSGSHKKYFTLVTEPSPSAAAAKVRLAADNSQTGVQLKFRPTKKKNTTSTAAAYRVSILFTFLKETTTTTTTTRSFSILRSMMLRTGDSDMYDALKPQSPYIKKKRKNRRNHPIANDPNNMNKEKIHPPPKQEKRSRGGGYRGLLPYKIPHDIRQLVEANEMEQTIVPPFSRYIDYNNNNNNNNNNKHATNDIVSEEKIDDDDDNSINEQEFGEQYATFWQAMLWTSELQAYDDIQLFDLENVPLEPSTDGGGGGGRSNAVRLYVSGLAEGRPSVLRGDIVICVWDGQQYLGRVVRCEQLHVVMKFGQAFAKKKFDFRLDRLDRVRFTFSRTPFRASHAGVMMAPNSMLYQTMLLPTQTTFDSIVAKKNTIERICPEEFRWTATLSGSSSSSSSFSSSLNKEQKQAVREIVKGSCRPMPYIVFGPPGTGKTTTLVEAVYHLANLHTYNKDRKTKKQLKRLKILLVAPSNDATDILVERLAAWFPPSEMTRVLAYTRSLHQVSAAARPYCMEISDDPLSSFERIAKIKNVQITVATVNMAARLWCTTAGDGTNKKNQKNDNDASIPRGYFDVLCVDEAGHATEPEIISAAATLLDFHSTTNNPAQIVLAGDPKQLGPIITSDLCKKFKMDQSYMERLIKTSPAYNLNDETATGSQHQEEYKPELVTFLANNYRSHPDILKLPNEMFYRNQLVPCGDRFVTNSMTNWEYLPIKGFPVLFHAVDGENCREGSSPSWFNPQEAMVIVDYVKKLVEDSKPKVREEDIGIITPYARQVQKIRTALSVAGIGDVKVGSVETFQGQERRVILISTVRSENDLLAQDRKYNLGFVANEKRFNVAITRAKALLIVVGNPRVLATDKENWLPLLQFCHDKQSWLGEEWDENAAYDDHNDDEHDETFEIINSDDVKNDDADEWTAIVQEGHGFINREE